MICNDLEKYIVKIESGSSQGSGVLVKPSFDSEYIYILTAKHVVVDSNDIKIKYRENGEFREKKFIKKIQNIPDSYDLTIFIAKSMEFEDLKILKIYNNKAKNSQAIGYPNIKKDERECLELTSNELSSNPYLGEVKSTNDLSSFNNSEEDNTSGFSGGGIFTNSLNGICLIGIITHVITTAFQGFKYVNLEKINDFIGEYPKIDIIKEHFESRKIDNIRAYSQYDFESANIRIDNDFEKEISLDNLYIKRDIEDDIFDFLGNKNRYKGIIINGEAGNGKTSLLWKIAKKLKDDNQECWFIKSTHFLDNENFFEEITEVITIFRKNQNSDLFLLIDTIDLLASNENLILKLQALIYSLENKRVIIILTSRPREANQFILSLKKYKLAQYSDNDSSTELRDAIESYVDSFYAKSQTLSKEESLNKILNAVSKGRPLKEVCRHPLTLRMLFIIYFPDSVPEEINIFKLYRDFWNKRIENDIRAGDIEDNFSSNENKDLSNSTGAIALVMLTEGNIEIDFTLLKDTIEEFNGNKDDIGKLITRNILMKSNKMISFFHQTFFEHSCSRGFVKTIKKPLDTLEKRVQPSFDDLFLMPIYEHTILLTDLKGVRFRKSINNKLINLKDGNFNSKYSAIYIFLHLENMNNFRKEILKELIVKDDKKNSLTRKYLSMGYNMNRSNFDFTLEILNIIWKKRDTNNNLYILKLLEEISYLNENKVYQFIIDNDINKYIIEKHQEKNRKSNKAYILDFSIQLVKLYIQLLEINPDFLLKNIINLITTFNEIGDTVFEMKSVSYLMFKDEILNNEEYLFKVLDCYNDKKYHKDTIHVYGFLLYRYFKINSFNITEIISFIDNNKTEVYYPILISSLSDFVRTDDSIDDLNKAIIYFEKNQNLREMVFWSDLFFLKLLGQFRYAEPIEKISKFSFTHQNHIREYIKDKLYSICIKEDTKTFFFLKKVLHENKFFEIEEYKIFNDPIFRKEEYWLNRKKLKHFLVSGYIANNQMVVNIMHQSIENGTHLFKNGFSFMIIRMIELELINEKNIIFIIDYIIHYNNLSILKKIYNNPKNKIVDEFKREDIIKKVQNYLLNNISKLKNNSSPSNKITNSIEILKYFLRNRLIENIKYSYVEKLLRYNNPKSNEGNSLDTQIIELFLYINIDEKREYLKDIFNHIEIRVEKSNYHKKTTMKSFEVLKEIILTTEQTPRFIINYYNFLINTISQDDNIINNIAEYSNGFFPLLTDLVKYDTFKFTEIFCQTFELFNTNNFSSSANKRFGSRIKTPLNIFFRLNKSKENIEKIFNLLNNGNSLYGRGIISGVYRNFQNIELLNQFEDYIKKISLDGSLLTQILNYKEDLKSQKISNDWVELYELVKNERI